MTLNDISCFQVDISIALFLPVPYRRNMQIVNSLQTGIGHCKNCKSSYWLCCWRCCFWCGFKKIQGMMSRPTTRKGTTSWRPELDTLHRRKNWWNRWSVEHTRRGVYHSDSQKVRIVSRFHHQRNSGIKSHQESPRACSDILRCQELHKKLQKRWKDKDMKNRWKVCPGGSVKHIVTFLQLASGFSGRRQSSIEMWKFPWKIKTSI